MFGIGLDAFGILKKSVKKEGSLTEARGLTVAEVSVMDGTYASLMFLSGDTVLCLEVATSAVWVCGFACTDFICTD